MYQPLFHIFMWLPASLVFLNFILYQPLFHIFIIMWPPASRSHIFFNCCLARLVIDVILLKITTRTLGLRWWLMAQQKSVITQNWICIIQVESGNKYCIFFLLRNTDLQQRRFSKIKKLEHPFSHLLFLKNVELQQRCFPKIKKLERPFSHLLFLLCCSGWNATMKSLSTGWSRVATIRWTKVCKDIKICHFHEIFSLRACNCGSPGNWSASEW